MTYTTRIHEPAEPVSMLAVSNTAAYVSGIVDPTTGPADTTLVSESTTAVRFNEGKLDWSLMPWDSLEEILKVLEFGKIKYSSWNWSKGEGFTYTSLFGCMSRHLFAWIRGEDNDPESGLSHIAHLGCNVLFLLYFIKHKNNYKNNDDRPN